MGQKFLYLGLAGALGTLARYGLSGLVHRVFSTTYPLGTAAVNIAGCLLFGLFWAIAEGRLTITAQMKMVLFLGFFGAFTTFSTFTFETTQLMNDSQWLRAGGHLFLQNGLGLLAMYVGLTVGKWI